MSQRKHIIAFSPYSWLNDREELSGILLKELLLDIDCKLKTILNTLFGSIILINPKANGV